MKRNLLSQNPESTPDWLIIVLSFDWKYETVTTTHTFVDRCVSNPPPKKKPQHIQQTASVEIDGVNCFALWGRVD